MNTNKQQENQQQQQQERQPLLASLVKPGHSRRADYPLIPSKTALLIIDIQDHLSSPPPVTVSTSASTSASATTSATTSATIVKSDGNTKENTKHEEYLFSTALPKALPNMVQLVDTFRSIRDDNGNSSSDNSATNNISTSSNGTSCEVIFTYLESLTTNNRDISLDYKLSGPTLSTKIPNTIHKATFDTLPTSLIPNSTLKKGDILIPKTSCSVFNSTNICYILKNLDIEQIVICGQLTDQCVLSSVRDGADLGYFVTVVDDACAALSVEDHRRGIEGMRGFSRVLNTMDVLKEINVERTTTTTYSKESISNNNNNNNNECDDDKLTIYMEGDTKRKTMMEMTPTNTQKHATNKLILPPIQSWKPSHNSYNNNSIVDTLLHVLQCANIKFLRYTSIDITNSIRTKVIPIRNLLHNKKHKNRSTTSSSVLNDQVSIAKVCMGGLPYYADMILQETNLNSRHVLIIQPDLSSLRILPYTTSSAMVFGTLHKRRSGNGKSKSSTSDDNDVYGEVSEFCTRSLLQRVVQTAGDELGIGFGVGAEIEFILVRRRTTNNKQEGQSTTTNDSNVMDRIEPVDSTVFASATTLNEQDDFINDVYENLQKQNIDIETLHSESAPGQMEIVLPYQTNVIQLADMVVLTRETIKACARKYDLYALFLPKVFENSAGNGMHVHLSLTSINDPEHNLFPSSDNKNNIVQESDDQQQLLSSVGESFLEGILFHLKALTSLTMPTVNSFRRVGPGCWTGHSVCWMLEEKECPLRVCLDLSSAKATNVEYKLLDSSCNIYLALAGILFAGMDGIIQNMKLRPMMTSEGIEDNGGGSFDDNENILPKSIEESLHCLSNDRLLSELLGEKMSTSYTAVKKAEAKYAQQKSLLEEIEEALNR